MYSYIETSEENYAIAEEIINNKLPHGSGIDSDWCITEYENNRFTATNTYSAMDENGMYCHDYNFSVEIDYIDGVLVLGDIFVFNEDICDCGYGLTEYLNDTIYYCFTS